MRASMAADGRVGVRALRREIAALEGFVCPDSGPRSLPLGVAAVDAALGGGLKLGATHEIAPASPVHRGAAFGFALALAGKARAHSSADDVVWIETAFASAETGRPYGIGLINFGLALAHLIVVRVPRPLDVLWATEEALACRGVAAVIAEVAEEPALTATRRLALAARRGGGLGLVVRHRAAPAPSAAMTRWQVAAARSRPDAHGAPGPAALDLSLTKNRHGRCGRWTILWDHHERVFVDPALSVGMAAAAFDRPDRARLRAGRLHAGRLRAG
jgi:protein ImuA